MTRVRTSQRLVALVSVWLVATSVALADSRETPEAHDESDWRPFVIQPGHETLVRKLMEPYWSDLSRGVQVPSADISKTYVTVGVRLGTTDAQLFLLAASDHATQIKPEPTLRVQNTEIAVLARCGSCTEQQSALLKKVAENVLTNQVQAKETLWAAVPKAPPRPHSGPSTDGGPRIWQLIGPFVMRHLGQSLVVLAIALGIWLRLKARRAPIDTPAASK